MNHSKSETEIMSVDKQTITKAALAYHFEYKSRRPCRLK